MRLQQHISFSGPYSWVGSADAPSVFDVGIARTPGIYLWTVSLPEGFLIYYVGETGRSQETRLLEHYKEHAACMYHIYSPSEFAKGEKVTLWPGHYDLADRKTTLECIEAYPNLTKPISDLTRIYRFFLAPLSCESRVRRRIEAAMADVLYSSPGLIGQFQDIGIRYDRRKNGEEPIECDVSSSAPLLGLPSRLLA